MIEFDSATAKALEEGYSSPDVTGQRAAVLEHLRMRPGEAVLDIGSGPGLLVYDIAKLVGDQGQVVGMDMSPAMNEMASERCQDFPHVSFKEGDATALPFEDNTFDVAVSTQVYEYVADMPTALAELHRVMKPGGRILILDTDWDSLVVNTKNRDLHNRVTLAWDEHLADPNLPSKLIPLLKSAGFQMTASDVFPLLNTELQANTYSGFIIPAIANFVGGRQGVSEADAQLWRTHLIELGAEGKFFFSLNRYLFQAIKQT